MEHPLPVETRSSSLDRAVLQGRRASFLPVWRAIGGTDVLNHKSAIVDHVRAKFESILDTQFKKTPGGATYQVGSKSVKVAGYHMFNCTLRPIAAAVDDDEDTPLM